MSTMMKVTAAWPLPGSPSASASALASASASASAFPSPSASPPASRPGLLPLSRRDVLAVVAASCLAGGAFAQGTARGAPALAFELISPAEAGREREARAKSGEAPELPEARTRSLPGAAPLMAAPNSFAIRVLVPTPQAAVTAPLRIELLFDTPPGTRVVPSTFRVLYGVLKIDLTERPRRASRWPSSSSPTRRNCGPKAAICWAASLPRCCRRSCGASAS